MQRSEPIRLSAETHRALGQLGTRFSTRSHLAYITEAHTAACNAPDDPLAALALLVALQGSAYASRRNQRPALAEIGKWLEDHLTEHLNRCPVDRRLGEVIAVELGWLRRMAKAEKKRLGRREAAPDAAAPKSFGARLKLLAGLWRAVVTDPEVPLDSPEDPESLSTPEPEEITTLQVGFRNVLGAREVWKVARARIKRNRAPKDRCIPLSVRAPTLPPSVVVEASITVTEGLIEIFRDFDQRGGQVRDFVVSQWREEGDRWVAERATLGDG